MNGGAGSWGLLFPARTAYRSNLGHIRPSAGIAGATCRMVLSADITKYCADKNSVQKTNQKYQRDYSAYIEFCYVHCFVRWLSWREYNLILRHPMPHKSTSCALVAAVAFTSPVIVIACAVGSAPLVPTAARTFEITIKNRHKASKVQVRRMYYMSQARNQTIRRAVIHAQRYALE